MIAMRIRNILQGFLLAFWVSLPSAISTPVQPRMQVGIVQDFHQQSKDLACIVEALVYEAFTEPLEGVEAVMSVIVNRKNRDRSDFCSVIHKPYQFSYRNAYPIGHAISVAQFEKNRKLSKIKSIAKQAVSGTFRPTLPPSVLHYAHKRVKNKWTVSKEKHRTIGNHTFYNN